MKPTKKQMRAEREWLAVFLRGTRRGSAEKWKARNNRHVNRIAARS